MYLRESPCLMLSISQLYQFSQIYYNYLTYSTERLRFQDLYFNHWRKAVQLFDQLTCRGKQHSFARFLVLSLPRCTYVYIGQVKKMFTQVRSTARYRVTCDCYLTRGHRVTLTTSVELLRLPGPMTADRFSQTVGDNVTADLHC